MRLAAILALPAFAIVATASIASSSCSQGDGQGSVRGTLDVPNCWSGAFDLQPNFFAAVPYQSSLELRIQNGGDYETFSDGVVVLIDDFTKIRPSPTSPGLYGQALAVDLPVGVTPPGVPITPNPNPANVHMSLYLQRSCQTINPALYAMESVTLNATGGCDIGEAGAPHVTCPGSGLGLAPTGDGGALDGSADASDASASNDAGAIGEAGAASGSIAHSSITFTSLFNGNEDEVSATARLNQGTFQVYLADPHEICPGGIGPPPPCRGVLNGDFKYYFERGRPEQPFP